MTLELPSGKEAFVKFKDYAFFVPKNAQNEEVIVIKNVKDSVGYEKALLEKNRIDSIYNEKLLVQKKFKEICSIENRRSRRSRILLLLALLLLPTLS